MCNHAACIYDQGRSLIQRLARFAIDAFEHQQGFLLIATRRHTAGLLSHLSQIGLDPHRRMTDGDLVCMDANKILSEIMRGGREPKECIFRAIADNAIHQAQRAAGLRAYGELVDLLWDSGNQPAAHQLELWWDEIVAEQELALWCGYRVNIFGGGSMWRSDVEVICRSHGKIILGLDQQQLDASVEAALARAIPEANVQELRAVLTHRCRDRAKLPSPLATLAGLHDILPSLADDVRMLAHDHFTRGLPEMNCAADLAC